MQDLISLCNQKDKDIMTKILTYVKQNVSCLSPGNYSTHFSINKRSFVFCMLEFNEQETHVFVWELGNPSDNPIIKTEMLESVKSFSEMIPDIILTVRQLLIANKNPSNNKLEGFNKEEDINLL